MLKYLIFVCTFLLSACNAFENNNSDPLNINLIKKEWKHSFEEELESTLIFRPTELKQFPIARYRQSYLFIDDGKCTYLALDSLDAHYLEKGFWNFESNSNELTILNPEHIMIAHYKIIQLSEYILELDRLY